MKKNPKLPTSVKYLLFAGVLIGFHTPAISAVLLDFGSNGYASGNTSNLGALNGYDASDITPSTGYSGPTFFGGSQLPGSVSVYRIESDIANSLDALRVRVGSGAAGSTGYFLWGFDKSQFSDANAQTNGFSVDSSSSLELGAVRLSGSTAPGDSGIRWMLQDGSNFYISSLDDSNAAQFGVGYDVVGSGDLTGLSWFNYNPSTSISTIGSAAVIDFGTATFDAAGMLYANSRVGSSSGTLEMQYAEFNVNATAVPEHSSFAMISGLLALGWILLRRR